MQKETLEMKNIISYVHLPLFLLLLPFASSQSLRNRGRWLDLLVRAESRPHLRDRHVINLPWTAEAERLFRSLPFPLRETLVRFTADFGQAAAADDVSHICFRALKEFRRQLDNSSEAALHRVALKMVDAFGRPSAGFFEGANVWVGSLDECLRLRRSFESEGEDNGLLAPNHCVTTLRRRHNENLLQEKLTNDSVVVVGTCFPAKCQPEDVAILLKFGFSANEDEGDTSTTTCHSDVTLDTKAIVAIGFVCILVLFIVVGSVTDRMAEARPSRVTEEKKSQPEDKILLEVLFAFSFQRNLREITRIDSDRRRNRLAAVDGIRVLSLAWIIAGHTIIYAMPFMRNFASYASSVGVVSAPAQLLVQAPFAVDSFFLLTGILVAVNFVEAKRRNDFNVGTFYLHRILRLTPLYMITVWLWYSLNPLLKTTSPLWPREGFDQVCGQIWWTNLLYLNNIAYFLQNGMCYGISWYLACDMQFYLLSPLFLYALNYSRIAGAALTSVAIFVHVGYMIWSTLIFRYESGMFFDTDQAWTPFNYIFPVARIGPFLVGILAGVFIVALRLSSCPKIAAILKYQLVSTILWILSLGLLALLILVPLKSYHEVFPLSSAQNVVYASFSRVAWATALSWIVVACQLGSGGPMNALLTNSAMIVLSRVSYSAFLLHYVVHICFAYSMQSSFDFTIASFVWMFTSNMTLTYLGAIVVSATIERPIMKLEATFCRRLSSSSSSSSSSHRDKKDKELKVIVTAEIVS